MSYKQMRDLVSGAILTSLIQRIEDGASIPTDPGNRDYQEFLTWAKTNTLAPADPVADPALETSNQRAAAVNAFNADPTPLLKLIRAVLLVILDEVNVIRAALSLPPRTAAQFRTAVQNKLNQGNAD